MRKDIDFNRFFEIFSKDELMSIWTDYLDSKDQGKRSEILVDYARQYESKLNSNGFLPFTSMIDIIEDQFFNEIARRYFEEE